MKRLALCMRGAISKVSGGFLRANELYNTSEYVDYIACYNSIVRHIIQANKDYVVDVFCHSWNPDLEQKIRDLYSPVKASFEDNRLYNDYIKSLCRTDTEFGGVSSALTMKKSIELKEEYETENNFTYDSVIVYRYDVLLWKDIDLSRYTQLDKAMYVDGNRDSTGEFYFLMNSRNSILFKHLIDSIPHGNYQQTHYWIKKYVTEILRLPLLMDEILPGKNIEVMREVALSISAGHLSIEQFNSYKESSPLNRQSTQRPSP